MEILTNKENPLFNRKEVIGTIHSEIVPNKKELAKLLSEKLKSSEDAIKIRSLKGKFGQKIFTFDAHVYHNKEGMDSVEKKTKKELAAEKKA